MAIRDLVRNLAAGGTRSYLMPGGSWSPHDMPTAAALRGGGRSGRAVTYDRALAHRAVYSCVDVLCRLVVWNMPIEAYRSGERVALPAIVVNPSPYPQVAGEHWRTAALEAAALRGYAAGAVVATDPLGWPTKIDSVHPDLVRWRVDRDTGRVRWTVNGKPMELFQHGGELWIAPAMRVGPGAPVGLSTIRYAAETIDLGLEARQFAGDFFRAGGMPLQHAKVTSRGDLNEEQIEVIRARILTATEGRRPLVTGQNVDLAKIDVSADDAQFLETMRANVADVASYFGIPPETIGGSAGGSGITYATVEGRNLELLTNTVGAWMRWWAVTLGQLTPPDVELRLDPEALLQTSVRALYETVATGLGRGTPGVLTPNEARSWLGYPALDDPEANVLYRPSSVVPIPNPTDPAGATA